MSECKDKIDSIIDRLDTFLNRVVEGELSNTEQGELMRIEKELEFYLSRFALFEPEPKSSLSHYHVNNGMNDDCKECGLDLFNIIHKREL